MLAGCELPASSYTNAQTQQFPGGDKSKPNAKPQTGRYGQVETELPDCQAYFKRIDGQLFIDGCATKFDLRHFNVLAVKDIQIVFVSTFQELYGAPFLSMHPQFRGKIYMTQPLQQIGQNLLYEFVKLNRKRNSQKAQQMSFFEQEAMYQEFSRMGLEDWLDLYTEEDIHNFFTNHVVVLNHNERHAFDNLVSLTPVSSGFHIGSSNWCVEVAQMKLALITNASLGVEYRHPMPFNGSMLRHADCMFINSVVL